MTVFIPKNNYHVDRIKRQLKEKGITDIDVLPIGSDISKYTEVHHDVEPNKEVAYTWDFGSLQLHGDPRDDFDILPSNTETPYINTRNKNFAWEYINEIQGKDLFMFTGSEYETVIKHYRGINYKEADSDKVITSMMVQDDPQRIIEGLFELMFRLYGENYAYKKFDIEKGKEKIARMKNFYYKDSHIWTASSWVDLHNDLDDEWKKNKVIKALKTRCKNIIKKPSNLYALKFFAEKLREDLVGEDDYQSQQAKNTNRYSPPEITVDESKIPF